MPELRVSSPLLLRELATAVAITRDKKITKVFNTPCNNAIVTISPLEIWEISCAKTASASASVMLFNNPVLTATKELLFVAPVAKAFTSGE